MRIAHNRVVSIDYTIRLVDGRVVESTLAEAAGPLVYLHGRSQIVPGVERGIEGAEPGQVLELEVDPGDAYGPIDPEGLFLVPRSAFPPSEEVAPGMSFSAARADGAQVVFQVVRVVDDMVLIDTNHPLAGQTLLVSVAVRAVREATGEELDSGKVLEEAPAAAAPS